MFSVNKYKNSLYINFENSLNYDLEKNVDSNVNSVNYVFKHKNKLFRNFILIYSTFLMKTFYSNFLYKSNPEYKIIFDLSYFLFIDSNVILY